MIVSAAEKHKPTECLESRTGKSQQYAMLGASRSPHGPKSREAAPEAPSKLKSAITGPPFAEGAQTKALV